jgi:hypothetical protein
MSFKLVTVMIEKVFTTRQKIADELGIDVKTLRKCLKKYNVDLKPGLVPQCVLEEIKEKFKLYKSSKVSAENGTEFEGKEN